MRLGRSGTPYRLYYTSGRHVVGMQGWSLLTRPQTYLDLSPSVTAAEGLAEQEGNPFFAAVIARHGYTTSESHCVMPLRLLASIVQQLNRVQQTMPVSEVHA